MKCVIATKSTKHVNVGDVKRVDNEDADMMVSGGYWNYTSKNEFRKFVDSTTEKKTPKKDTKKEI